MREESGASNNGTNPQE